MNNSMTLDKKAIQIRLDAKDRVEVLNRMSEILKNEGYVKESYCDAIIKREENFATGIPTGAYSIAIPHTDIEHVNEPMIAIATLENPIKFFVMGSSDEEVDVKIVFMLAMKDRNNQIKLLSNLMAIVQDEKLLEEIYEAKEKEKLVSLVNSKLEF